MSSTKDSKHSAVWNWLKKCPSISDLFFNIATAEDGVTTLTPSESVNIEYADGSKEYYYDVALTRWFAESFDPNDMANINALIDFSAVGAWVEDKNKTGDLPVFPANHIVNSVTVMPNQSGFIVETETSIAKFMLEFRIEYLKTPRKD